MKPINGPGAIRTGTFRYPIEIGATEAGPFLRLEAIVDTGAAYSWVPRELLLRLGVVPRERRRFVVADGRIIERDIGIVAARLDGRTQPTVCVFGDDGSEVLLGAVTLEEFALGADPLNQRLVPLPQLYLLRTG